MFYKENIFKAIVINEYLSRFLINLHVTWRIHVHGLRILYWILAFQFLTRYEWTYGFEYELNKSWLWIIPLKWDASEKLYFNWCYIFIKLFSFYFRHKGENVSSLFQEEGRFDMNFIFHFLLYVYYFRTDMNFKIMEKA